MAFYDKLQQRANNKLEAVLKENASIADELWDKVNNARFIDELNDVKTEILFSNNLSRKERNELLTAVERKIADELAYQSFDD